MVAANYSPREKEIMDCLYRAGEKGLTIQEISKATGLTPTAVRRHLGIGLMPFALNLMVRNRIRVSRQLKGPSRYVHIDHTKE